MRQTTRRQGTDRSLSRVNESIRRASMSHLLIEADAPAVPTNVVTQTRTKFKKALADTAAALQTAGFGNTQKALLKGVALLNKHINDDDEEDKKAANLFVLVPVLISATVSMLTSITTQADEEGVTGDEKTLKDLYKNEDGEFDPEMVKSLISSNFKPNPGYWKYLKKNNAILKKIGLAGEWMSQKAAAGAAKESRRRDDLEIIGEDLFSHHFDEVLQEGLLDALKGFFNFFKGFWTSEAVTSKATVQSLLPLLGGAGIHKLLMEDMKEGKQKIGDIRTAAGIINGLAAIVPGAPAPAPAPAAGGGGDAGDGGGGGGGGGGGTGRTSASDVAAIAADVDIPRGRATEIIRTVERDGGMSREYLEVLRLALSGRAGREETTTAASRLSPEDIASIAAALRSAETGASAATVAAAATATPSSPGAPAAAPATATVDDEDLEILDTLPGARRILRLIRTAGGSAAPAAIDAAISGSDELRRALDLAGYQRPGNAIHESGRWVSFLFEETIDPTAVEKLKLGPDQGFSGENEINDEEAKEIAKAIKDAAQGGKEKRELQGKVRELQTQVEDLRGRSLEAFRDSASVQKLAELLGKSEAELVDLLKKPADFEQAIREKAGRDKDLQSELATAARRVELQAQAIANLEREKQNLKDELNGLKIELEVARGLPKSIPALTKFIREKIPELKDLGKAGKDLVPALERLGSAAAGLADAGARGASAGTEAVASAASGVGSVIGRLYDAAMEKGPAVGDAVRKFGRMFTRALRGEEVAATPAAPASGAPRKLSDVLGDPAVDAEKRAAIKGALDDPNKVSIVVDLGDTGGLTADQKGKIKAALDADPEFQAAEQKAKSIVKGLFTAESRYRHPTDEIIVERWQRLAGIVK